MIDLLIKNAVIITINPTREVFLRGTVAIHAGKILAVGSGDALQSTYQAKTEIDGSGFVLMPGLINTHMHLPQVLMRGVYDNMAAMDKLKDYTWPIQGCYDEGDALASTRLGLLEMIKSGTTSFISTGLHPRYNIPAVLQAIVDSGMRAAASKYVMDTGGYALDKSALHVGMRETGEESKRQALELINGWHGAGNGRLQMWISPRSVGGCSLDLFKWVVETARQRGVGITTHWSEVQNNVDYTVKNYGLKPVFFAEKIGLLGPDVVLAHAIYLDDDEIDLLARTATSVAHCPVCNSKLAMGIARVPQMLRARVNVTLANDGMGVNNTADLFREMRTMLLLHRATQSNPLYPTAAEALEMSTLNGARALGLANQIGSIDPGKRADLIMVRLDQPHLVPVHDPVSAMVWAATGRDVDTVIVDGQILMRGRKVLTMDEDAIVADAEARREKILVQAGVTPQHVWPLVP